MLERPFRNSGLLMYGVVSIPRKGLEVLVHRQLEGFGRELKVSIPRKGLEVLVPLIPARVPSPTAFQSLGRG